MRRAFLIIGIILAALLLMQLIRPEKNLGKTGGHEDFLLLSRMPDTLARIFLNSCYDCHSNHSNYPWYGNLAPASWMLNSHIKEGKSHLNFSSWGTMDRARKISILDKICIECSEGAMPLKSYLMMHRTASLGPHEIEAICAWSEQAAMEIMKSPE